MSYRHFLEEIRKGLPSANYLLSSSDPFLQSEALSALKALVPAEERDFNFQAFDLLNAGTTEPSFDQIIDILNTMPFFAGRKYVAVGNLQKLLKKDVKKLEQYLAKPSESSVMVLFNTGAVKKDLKELKGLKQIALDIREGDLPVWLKEKAGAKGFKLSDGAAEYLIGTIGPDLGLLSSEIEKCTLIGKPTVEKSDLVEIIEGKRTYSAFELIDAIRARDTARVFGIYKILGATEEPYSLLGALNWQFSKYLASSTSAKDREYCLKVFQVLHEADVQIKSSGGYYPVELLLVKLLRLSRQR